ncbi:hypothetical protein HDU93_004575 [Gonapodya sp. JEL0774]|nr:hypothetical protein HDU93_004575 [Gonapodya sp. JEL0774]
MATPGSRLSAGEGRGTDSPGRSAFKPRTIGDYEQMEDQDDGDQMNQESVADGSANLLKASISNQRKRTASQRSRRASGSGLSQTLQRVGSNLFNSPHFANKPIDGHKDNPKESLGDDGPRKESAPFEWMAEENERSAPNGLHKPDVWGDDEPEQSGCLSFWSKLSTVGRWVVVNSGAALILLPIFFVSKFGFNDAAKPANVALSLWALFFAITVFSMAGCRVLVWIAISAWKRSDRRLQNVEKTELVESLQGWITIALWSIINYSWWIWILLSQGEFRVLKVGPVPTRKHRISQNAQSVLLPEIANATLSRPFSWV